MLCFQMTDFNRCTVRPGDVFGRLTVQSLIKMPNGTTGAKVICCCGVHCEVYVRNLKSGTTRSCGCLRKDRTKESRTSHGCTGKAELGIYLEMVNRCKNKDSKSYRDHGSRGITVCDRWLEPDGKGFLNFLEDMGERPSKEYSIDRIDVNSGCYPENCRWADICTQAYNKRRRQDNTSGRTGVYWHKPTNKWVAIIRVSGKQKHLGSFDSFELAVKAREKAELDIYGELKPEAKEYLSE